MSVCFYKVRSLAFFTVASVLVGQSTSFAAGVFSDSTEVNVLRQYNEFGVQLVTTSQPFINNGSASGPLVTSGVGTVFTLPAPRTVSSYSVQFGGYGAHRPDSFLLEGWTGSSYESLINVASPGGTSFGNFSSGTKTVTKIRFTPTKLSGFIVPGELQIFAAPSLNIDTREGFNLLRGATVTSQSSPKTLNIWKPIDGDVVSTVIDGDYGDGPHIKVLADGTGTERAYMAFKLDGARKMDRANMGFYPGQGWETFEIYTATTDLVASLNSIGTYPNKAAMQAAGWTLQYEHSGSTVSEPINSPFLAPGEYQYVVWVANEGQSGAPNEFEVFGVPEPTSAAMLLGGSALLGLRRRRRA